jgi:hypothetical protein
MMETTVKEIATVLRSTETMADQFAKLVQERVGRPVSYTEILASMEEISARSLTMSKVVAKLKRKRKKK